ncbi:MAG: TetR/AcrR family transcriptional regulator [Deltaproteobacteria bacterium]|nr:TetR/AcrR family transcriptional regulator [Deltaproteobacteria bacterium]
MSRAVKTPLRRKELERQARRALVIGAAELAFASAGFDRVSMAEIAQAVDLGMQALYALFPSKEALYEALLLDRLSVYRGRADAVMRDARDAVEAMRGVARVFAELFMTAPHFFPTYLREQVNFAWGNASSFSDEVRRAYRAEEARLRKLIQRAIKEGAIPPGDAGLLTQLALATFHATVSHYLSGELRPDVEDCATQAHQAFMGAARALS